MSFIEENQLVPWSVSIIGVRMSISFYRKFYCTCAI